MSEAPQLHPVDTFRFSRKVTKDDVDRKLQFVDGLADVASGLGLPIKAHLNLPAVDIITHEEAICALEHFPALQLPDIKRRVHSVIAKEGERHGARLFDKFGVYNLEDEAASYEMGDGLFAIGIPLSGEHTEDLNNQREIMGYFLSRVARTEVELEPVDEYHVTLATFLGRDFEDAGPILDYILEECLPGLTQIRTSPAAFQEATIRRTAPLASN